MQPYQNKYKYKFRYNTSSCIQYILQYTVYTIYSIKYIYKIHYTIQSVDTFD